MKITHLRWMALFMVISVLITYLTRGLAASAVVIVAGGLALECLRPHVAGHLFVYTGTTIAEIFIPEVYASIQPNDTPETTVFAQSGVIVTNPVLQAFAQAGAQKGHVPLWQDLDASIAPNLSDDTDTLATPGKVATTEMHVRNAFLNKGYGAADLAVELSGTTPGQGDPMTRIRNRFGTYWQRQFQYRIIAVLRGLLARNIANNGGDMLNNIALETTVGVADANRISAVAVTGAVFTAGDQFGQMRAIAMHSVVYQKLVIQEQITFTQPASNTLQIPTYLGMRVIIDDGLPVIAGTTSGFKYVSIIFGAGALGYGTGTPKVPAEIDRIPAGGNGGGLENIWERKTWLIHPTGHDWLDASVAGRSPTLAELRLAANWSRTFDRKNVPIAFLQTNA